MVGGVVVGGSGGALVSVVVWWGCFCDTTASHLISVGDFVVWTEVRIGDFCMFFVWAEYTNSPFPLPRCLLYFRECWRRAGW